MLMRNLFKCNFVNDGSRTLVESILIPEVAKAILDWQTEVPNVGVLIGGLALSYYIKPRSTVDGDFLFLTDSEIPQSIEKFKRSRPSAFLHKETHVEIEVLTPSKINMSSELAQKIIETAIQQNGIKVASREGLIASKLARFKLQDRTDISELLKLGDVDLSSFPLNQNQKANLQIALAEQED